MKSRLIVHTALLAIWASPLSLSAQIAPPAQGKIGVINIQTAITSTADGKKAIQYLQQKYLPRQQELQRLQQEIQAIQAKLTNQSTLSDAEQVRLRREAEDKQVLLKRSAEDAQNEFNHDRDETINKIGQKIVHLLAEYAQQNGFKLITDKSQVYFAAKNAELVDLTEQIVKQYDAESPVTDFGDASKTAAGASTNAGVVMVEAQTLAFINSLATDFVFFTSREHPISRLADITDPDSQFAVAEFTPAMMALRKRLGTGSSSGASPRPAGASQSGMYGTGVEFGATGLKPLGVTYQSQGGVTLMGIGDDIFGKLFQQHPEIKLFVAPRGTNGLDTIESTGGGMRVRFVESNAGSAAPPVDKAVVGGVAVAGAGAQPAIAANSRAATANDQSLNFRALPGEYISVVVTIVPSPGHDADLNATQLQLQVGDIEFDSQGKVTVVRAIDRKIKRLMGDDLTIDSPTDTVVARNGVIELALQGYPGHKLLLPITSSRTCRINNADFVLTPIATPTAAPASTPRPK